LEIIVIKPKCYASVHDYCVEDNDYEGVSSYCWDKLLEYEQQQREMWHDELSKYVVLPEHLG
jgi:hypothetical protein